VDQVGTSSKPGEVKDADQEVAIKNIGLFGAVRFDLDQARGKRKEDGTYEAAPFTAGDRARARKNIGVEEEYVRYDAAQFLTLTQQKRARDNIGVTNEKGEKGDTGATGPAGPMGPPGPGLAIPDILGALSAVPGFLLSLLSLLISLLTACGRSTGDSDVDNQLNDLRAYVLTTVNNLINSGAIKAKRRPLIVVVDSPSLFRSKS